MTRRRATLNALLCLALLAPLGCSGKPDADDAGKAAVPGGETEAKATGVTLSADALALSPVKVAPLAAATQTPVRHAFGQVIDTAALFQAASAASARRAELESAGASLEASTAELARVRALRADGENASERALDAALAAERTDRARVAAAKEQDEAGWSEVRQAWGDVITRWLQDRAPEVRSLASGADRLVLVTLTGGDKAASAAPEVSVERGGRQWPARLVSSSPRADPVLQGPSFFYRVVGADGALATGLNVAVTIPVGGAATGVLVPDGAVVRWSGVLWVYRQTAPGHFERALVADAQPVAGGLFVTSGLTAGEEIAVAGAAVLLSQELTDLGIAAPGGGD